METSSNMPLTEQEERDIFTTSLVEAFTEISLAYLTGTLQGVAISYLIPSSEQVGKARHANLMVGSADALQVIINDQAQQLAIVANGSDSTTRILQ